MPNRRTFLKRVSALPAAGTLLTGGAEAATTMKRDYFKELGVKPFINAAGTYTTLSASLMPREVMDAIGYASRKFYRLNEVQDAVGKRIAELTGAPAAMVTSGAAGALTCGTAACITGKDEKAIHQLPDVTGLKGEVLIQKSHRYGYDHAVRTCGVKLVEIETPDDFAQSAARGKTAMALFFNANEHVGKIGAADWVALGKKHGIPTFNDAAADTPPVNALSKYTKMGFDLVTFSGGKGIRGPQSAGLLLGRADLIEAARLNTSPYSDSIARGMKVNKEEMLGMLVALELYMKRDHDAEWKEWERRIRIISDAIAGIPSVMTQTKVYEIANAVPHLHVHWDQSKVRIAPVAVLEKLRAGEPSIEANPGTNAEELVIGVWMLEPGEAEVVARRVREILKSA
jgi:D-glucosaminate-6-phosphate ammonia-lyase